MRQQGSLQSFRMLYLDSRARTLVCGDFAVLIGVKLEVLFAWWGY